MSAVDNIKSRLDIVEYIGRSVPLKKAGRYWKACCPFHSERTPSFFVNPERQTWRCYGACGASGDIFDFVQRQTGLDFFGALEALAKEAGVELEQRSHADAGLYALLDEAALLYQRVLQDYDGAAAARSYMQQRGITPFTAEEFRLGYAPDAKDAITRRLLGRGFSETDILKAGVAFRSERRGDLIDYLRDRLVFPICDPQGRVIAFAGRTLLGKEPKYLNTPASPLFDKSRVLYGLDKARSSIQRSGAVIVEGYMDVISAHQAGFTNVVAQMGTALTHAQAKLLRRATIILALDGDVQPATIRRDLEQVMGLPNELRVVRLPADQDPDDVIRRDPDRWRQCVETASPIVDWLLSTLTLAPDAPLPDRLKAADDLLPLLMAVESDLYRRDNVQRLALRLRLPERELIERAAPPSAELVERPAPLPLSSSVIETYVLQGFVQHPDWYTRTLQIFAALEVAPFGTADFTNPHGMRLFVRACELAEVDIADYMGDALPDTHHELSADSVVWHALRLRQNRLRAELEELVFIDGASMRQHHQEHARVTEMMRRIKLI